MSAVANAERLPIDLLTIHEAASQLGKSPQTIRRMIKRGEIRARRVKTPQGFHYVISPVLQSLHAI